MPVIQFALDAIDSDFPLSGGNGFIVGMGLSVGDLRDQGFSNPPYRGNRIVTIDTGDAGWSDDCQPGWYFTNNSVQPDMPRTSANEQLDNLKRSFRGLHLQLHVWADGLDSLSRGQPIRLVQAGHNWLYYAHYAAYLVGSNLVDGTTFNNLSIAQRITWTIRMAQGAADVASPFEFYQREGSITDTSHDLYNGPTGPATWVNPATGTALNLADSLYAGSSTPFVPASTVDISTVNLADGAWIDSLTS